MMEKGTKSRVNGSSSTSGLTFKVASESWEFEQISRLNYETFVDEIPQHEKNDDKTLVDRFHDENTYFIGLKDGQLVGMVASRDKRPFSLDQKLDNLDAYLPDARALCEFRLLAIDRGYRQGRIIQGLLTALGRHSIERGYEIAVISGNVEQEKLYRRLGFVPFGPRVGSAEAMYQPMYRELATLLEDLGELFAPEHLGESDLPKPASENGRSKRHAGSGLVNLMPGPVGIAPEVREAFIEPPVSHRAPAFVEDMKATREQLCRLVGAQNVAILLGSGTLANDVVASQLSLRDGIGLILSNGEFGDRLIDHARRMGLSYRTLETGWGELFDRTRIVEALDESDASWVWAVHCETSTGVLNDMTAFKEVCDGKGVSLCMDCISSIGTVPVDLAGVHMASGVSGKGLGAYPGLSMVFFDDEVQPSAGRLPRYLDLGLHSATDGVAFTMSSNLLYALKAALRRFHSADVFVEIAETSARLRRSLLDMGFDIVASDVHAAPAVITVALPPDVSSVDVGDDLERAGYLLSYNSAYLRDRNWLQFCLMGDFPRDAVEPLLDFLREFRPEPIAANASL